MHYRTWTLGNRLSRSFLTSVFLYVFCFDIVTLQLSIYTNKSSTSPIRSPWGSCYPTLTHCTVIHLSKLCIDAFQTAAPPLQFIFELHTCAGHTPQYWVTCAAVLHTVTLYQNIVTGTPIHHCLSTPTSLVMTLNNTRLGPCNGR